MTILQKLINDFENIIKFKVGFDECYLSEVTKLVSFIVTYKIKILPYEYRMRKLISSINKKFNFDSDNINKFYTYCAIKKVIFNYHQKNVVKEGFDSIEFAKIKEILDSKKVENELIMKIRKIFSPISKDETLKYLREECKEPKRLRKDKGDRNIKNEILKSLFSSYLFHSLEEKYLHQFFYKNYDPNNYNSSYFKQLELWDPQLFNRKSSLHILKINQKFVDQFENYSELLTSLGYKISILYNEMNNYGFLSFILDPISIDGKFNEWNLISDIILFGEKHHEYSLRKIFFRSQEIQKVTEKYIPNIDIACASFELVNEGFTYRDTFTIHDELNKILKIGLIFQKNKRDETILPCPSCRSLKVQGNSYPSLGIRSWECKNPLCPDRSKYNRGKRYSFRGLVMQMAVDDESNEIPKEIVKRWKRDVVTNCNEFDLINMLIRHYSFHLDTIHLYNMEYTLSQTFGRKINYHKLYKSYKAINYVNLRFFNRYLIESNCQDKTDGIKMGDDFFSVINGNALHVLKTHPESLFDGAVTSPPYYNAKKYSQWDNIYCYLYDMFNINKQVYRVLKNGSYYLYNIFDYFDNEKSIAFSAMGKKRMILSAYMAHMFQNIGFSIVGNIIWDKGEIEGKRSFNSGNFSPYYQSPLNCWEHVFILKKSGQNSSYHEKHDLISRVFKSKPVIKMINGKNTHGHSAPFPDSIPELIIKNLKKDSIVLDPFAGSLTTGRVAERNSVRSVCIELSKEYCELGLSLREKNYSLF